MGLTKTTQVVAGELLSCYGGQTSKFALAYDATANNNNNTHIPNQFQKPKQTQQYVSVSYSGDYCYDYDYDIVSSNSHFFCVNKYS